jgi:uncharacterized protein YndB with AHSA1/START domain
MTLIGRLDMRPEGETDLVFTRLFHAPPARVWTCFTDPKLVQQWLWAMEMPMIRCEMHVRPGGTYRWVWAGRDGREMGMGGTYIEVTPQSRIVNTESFDDDWTGGETLVTTEFAPVPDGTRMTLRVRYASSAGRTGAMATPMADGMEQAYSKLDALLGEAGVPA